MFFFVRLLREVSSGGPRGGDGEGMCFGEASRFFSHPVMLFCFLGRVVCDVEKEYCGNMHFCSLWQARLCTMTDVCFGRMTQKVKSE